MLATKIACPKCKVVLKPSKPLPVGQQINCPQCGALFAVSSQDIQARSAGPHPPHRLGGTYAEDNEGARLGANPALADVPASPMIGPRRQRGRVRSLILVFGSLLLFVAAGVGLAMWCFSALNKASDEERNENAEAAKGNVPPPKKKPKKQSVQEVHEAPLMTLPAADQARVNQAAERGVDYLRKTQDDISGAWPGGRLGHTALPALTLLACGVSKKDPAVRRAAGFIRANYATQNQTYDLALGLLFLDRLNDPVDEKLIQVFAYRLVGGQTGTGGWDYGCPIYTPEEQTQLASVLRRSNNSALLKLEREDFPKLMAADTQGLPGSLQNLPVLRTNVTARDQVLQGVSGDNSNTQFAVLAILASRRHGIPMERTLALIAHRFQTSQTSDGGWGYNYRGGASASMTCSGLLGTAVGLGLTNEMKAKSNRRASIGDPGKIPAVQKGLEYLSKTAVGNPSRRWKDHPMVNLYTLWSTERVAVIFRLKKIGDKDWYPWGAEILVANQKPDGHWEGGQYAGSSPTLDTSLALLFLHRANLAKELTAKLQVGG
jgi:hypothetical protein